MKTCITLGKTQSFVLYIDVAIVISFVCVDLQNLRILRQLEQEMNERSRIELAESAGFG